MRTLRRVGVLIALVTTLLAPPTLATAAPVAVASVPAPAPAVSHQVWTSLPSPPAVSETDPVPELTKNMAVRLFGIGLILIGAWLFIVSRRRQRRASEEALTEILQYPQQPDGRDWIGRP